MNAAATATLDAFFTCFRPMMIFLTVLLVACWAAETWRRYSK